MAASRTSFEKLQRDRAKKLKADRKRARRQGLDDGPVVITDDDPTLDEPIEIAEGPELTAPELLKLVEQIHEQFDAGTLSFEDFEEKKADLMARLPLD